jgi:hypothetical protein
MALVQNLELSGIFLESATGTGRGEKIAVWFVLY